MSSVRRSLPLDGIWQFSHEGGPWREATVPMPWQAQFPDLANSHGRALYRRSFAVPSGWDDMELALHFGAVSYHCTVRLNGEVLGTHEGSYLPFDIVVPRSVLREDNELELEVVFPSADRTQFPDFPFDEIPHGKQSWYGRVAGPWQSISLEGRREARLERVVIVAGDDRVARAQLEFTPAAQGLPAAVEIVDAEGTVHARGDVVARASVALELAAPDALLWAIGAPNLYWLVVTLAGGLDVARERFGFRSIATAGGGILLNGAPIYLRGALDQDYYSHTLYTTPSLELLETQARRAVELGLNTLRCHIKVPDPRYYDVADRFGLLVWTEVPNVATFTESSARRMRETLAGILARDGNHPSIIAWTIINEDWGTRVTENADHRAWLKQSYDWLKAQDPSRLVIDNSACFPNFHVKSDINDFHYYRSVPERRSEWDDLTAQFAANASWTYGRTSDVEWRGDEPLIVSEFGVWGLPYPGKLRDDEGREPFWFESGSTWGDGSALPHGLERRFADLALARVFGSFDAFIDAVQWYQFTNLRYQIEQIRLHPTITGYVVTELTDVHWEANGLLDMERNPRVFHDVFHTINADTVIVPRPSRYAAWSGQILPVELTVATGGKAMPAGAVLSWSGDAEGSIAVPATAALATAALGTVDIVMPVVTAHRTGRLEFTLTQDGVVLARNSCDIALYADRAAPQLKLAAPDADIAAHLAGLGYTIVPEAAADVVVVRSLDARRVSAIDAGAHYLVLADGTFLRSPNAQAVSAANAGTSDRLLPAGAAPVRCILRTDLPPAEAVPLFIDGIAQPLATDHIIPNMRLFAREGTIWRGDWIAGFSWLRRDGAFASIPGGPLFDLSFSSVVPHFLLDAVRPWEFGEAVVVVHSGVVVGWIHKPAAIVAEKQIGRGRLVVSTFRLLTESPAADPLAATLLDALVITCQYAPTDQTRGKSANARPHSSLGYQTPAALAATGSDASLNGGFASPPVARTAPSGQDSDATGWRSVAGQTRHNVDCS